MRTLKLSCPGIALRIRPQPRLDVKEIGLLKSDSVIDVQDDLINGFYELADGTGFVIASADGIFWDEIPSEEEFDLQINGISLCSQFETSSSSPQISMKFSTSPIKTSPPLPACRKKPNLKIDVGPQESPSLKSNSNDSASGEPVGGVDTFRSSCSTDNEIGSVGTPSENKSKASRPAALITSWEPSPSAAQFSLMTPSSVPPPSPSMSRDPKASVAKFIDFDLSEMDLSDINKRPTGWHSTIRYRVNLKESIDRLNGLTEDTIASLRATREIEEDLAMLQELKVAIKIQTFEKRNPVPIYPKDFHSALATARGEARSSFKMSGNRSSSSSIASVSTFSSTSSLPVGGLSSSPAH